MSAKTEEYLRKERERQENQLWDELQRRIETLKLTLISKNELRFERLKLIKKPESKAVPPPGPSDLSKVYMRMVLAGVALVLLTQREDLFGWKSGKEVEPQYLKDALQDGLVLQTWFHHIVNESNNDDEE